MLDVYSSLPSPTHTRLLELQPAEDPTAELRCRIHVVDLYNPEIALYEAISYVWGEPVFSHVLWIDNDAGGPNQLPITASLSEALRRFRRRVEPRFIWADAICINQKDDAEKSTHIPLMTDIYRGAAKVLVWLGNGQAEERTLSRIKAFARLIHSQSLSDSHRQDLLESVLDLLRLAWFSRRWIIQEAVLNVDVIIFCGAQRLSFLRLSQVLVWLPPSAWESSRHTRSLMAMFDLWKWWTLKQANEGTRGLLRLLQDFDHFGCADGRDRIYTLAALAEDVRLHTAKEELPHGSLGWHREIVVDYKVSTEEIYLSTALMIVNAGHLQWVLGQAMVRSGALCAAGIPSWVPDWRSQIQRRSFWPAVHTSPLLSESEPHCPIWQLASINAHLLRAWFTYVENWGSTIPDQYVGRWDVYNALEEGDNTIHSEEQGHILREKSWVWDLKSYLEKNAIAPMAITWKSEDFPNRDNSLNILTWVTSTFSAIWERVLLSLVETENIPGSVLLRKRAWDACVDRFTHVITAGGKFFELLDTGHQQNLIQLCGICDPSDDDWRDTSGYRPAPGESGDWDLMPKIRDSTGRIEVSTMSGIVRAILLDTSQDSSVVDAILALIAITMNGRCLFTCEVDWKPPHALAADIMGIGVTHLEEGDRILSFAPDAHDSRILWGNTMVVREATLDIDKVDDVVSEITQEHGPYYRQELPPPVYQLVGDCFLTTTRWVSPIRGLHKRSWHTQMEPGGYEYNDWSVHGVLDNRNSTSYYYDVILL
ncbi:hypothetical protein DL765_009699 [Monosporascus sp. GIB2]|nr:hypothetical protein DL765_009699 [Monosporascus sp. GIB2]